MAKDKKAYSIPTYRLQLVRDGAVEARAIESGKDLVKAVKKVVKSDREHFICFYLNARNVPIAHHIVSTGTLNANLVHPREVFKIAILKNAASIIIAHNHPSGNPYPSEGDDEITERIAEAAELLGFDLLDHVIIGPSGKAFSYQRERPYFFK